MPRNTLQWGDIDFAKGKVSIRRNIYRGQIGTPKTKSSRRAIPMVSELSAILATHRDRVKAMLPGCEWVFPSSTGMPYHAGALNSSIARAASIARLSTRITPHGLRRTLNTLALEIAPAETIRKILGHVTTEMTTRYNAPSLDAQRSVLAKVTKKLDLERGQRSEGAR